MKVLAIRGKNLASLAGEFDVDFVQEPLKSAGLFAISGPTGAGKSTLLDALCMALYERTPRLFKAGSQTLPDVGEHNVSQQDARNLLRRGCAEGYAEVDFAGSDGHSYRARWSVRRARGKVDGSLQKTTMSLHRLPDLQPLGGTNKEVLAEIHQRLGLSFEQFTRAVLLAQNEFSAFLKADDNERGELLETLTGSRLYSTLSQRAFARAKLEQQALQRINDRLADQKPLSDDVLAQLHQDSQLAQQLVDNLDGQKNQLVTQLRWLEANDKLCQEEQQAQQALAAAQNHQAAAAQRQAELQAVEAVQAARPLVDEVDRLNRAITQMQQQQVEGQQRTAAAQRSHHHATERLQLAHEKLHNEEHLQSDAVPHLERAKQLETRIATLAPGHQAAANALAQAHQAVQQLEDKTNAKQVEVHTAQTRQGETEAWLHHHVALQMLAEQWLRWDLLLKQSHTLMTDKQRHTAKLNDLLTAQAQQSQLLNLATATLASANQATNDATHQREAAQQEHTRIDITTLQRHKTEAQTRRDALRSAQQLHQSQLETHQRWHTLHADIATERQAADQAEALANAAQTRLPTLNALFAQADHALKTAQAACADSVEKLRAALQGGEACPVCGATAHPYVAHDPQLRAVLDSLQQQVSTCREQLDAAQQAQVQHSTQATAHRRQGEALQQQAAPLQASMDAQTMAWQNHPLTLELGDVETQAIPTYLVNAGCQVDAEIAQLAVSEQQWQTTLKKVDAAQKACDLATQAQYHAKDAAVAAQIRLDQLEVERQTTASQQHESDHQLNRGLDELEAARISTDGVDWRSHWQRDPQAFHAQCARNASLWHSQHKACELGQQTMATQLLELHTLQTQNQQAQVLELKQQAAFDASALTQSQLHTELQTLFQGQPVVAIVTQWANALQTLKEQHDQQRRAQNESQQALTRATEAQNQAATQLQVLQQELVSAALALTDWLNEHNHNHNHTSSADSRTVPLTLEALRSLLTHSRLWISQERAEIHALEQAVSLAATVLQERHRQRAAHQQQRPTKQLAGDVMVAQVGDEASEASEVLALQKALAEVSTAREVAQTQSTHLQLQLAQDQERRQRNVELLQELAAQEAQHRIWAQLNELIGAADGKKFRNYAQQTTLDVLLGYANRHLHELSRRYRLQRIKDTLALLVVDQDMGDEQRSVHSLSGGESFLVSLALALGLASLSSNRVKVESLFIDEGFGSLDADTLRVAMDALDGLQSLGRKVGVISHVQEMTERIATKIEVQRVSGGRSLVSVQQ